MKIDRLTRDGSHLHYFVLDDAGRELKQIDGDFPDLIAEASRRKKSVLQLIAEREGAVQVQSNGASQVVVVERESEVQPHEHPDYLKDLPEHRHDTTHQHPFYEDKIDRMAIGISVLDKQLEEHDHKHGHIDLANAIAEQGRDLTLHTHPFKEHDHPHDHEDTAKVIISQQETINALVARVSQLEARIGLHTHPLEKHDHEHDHPHDHEHEHPHEHREYAQALTDYVNDATRRRNVVLLSEQEVGGRKRFVLEELP